MNSYPILKSYNLIKINVSPEIWLKSMKVRMRMIKNLMRNISESFTRLQIPFHKYQLTADSTRILFFFNNEHLQAAMNALEKIFGVDSFSPGLRTSDKVENIIQRTIELGTEFLQDNDSFAIRVKRSGRHNFTSRDIAKKAGQAILDHFPQLKLKVDLSNPQKRIFLEIRGEFTYIFTDIIKSRWSGLPIEKNKKVLCIDVGRIHDLIAGFLLMRRGCEIYPVLFKLTNNPSILEHRLSNWREVAKYNLHTKFTVMVIDIFPLINKIKDIIKDRKYLCALCRLVRLDLASRVASDSSATDLNGIQAFSDGASLNNSNVCSDEIDLDSIGLSYLFSEYPIFTPLIGLESQEINLIMSDISFQLRNIDYCSFKPNHQVILKEEVSELYTLLNLHKMIDEVLKNTHLISIT